MASFASVSTSSGPGTSRSAGGFFIDMSQMKDFAARLRRFNPALAKTFRVGLRSIGELAKGQAEQNASWSTRIPGSIKVGVSGVSVKLTAGGPAAPHAAAYEHNGQPGTFRHPVFGNINNWVDEAARPFLGVVGDQKADEIEALTGKVIEDALTEAGL